MASAPRAYHIPTDAREGSKDTVHPVVGDAGSVAELCARVSASRADLVGRPLEDRILAIDRAAAGWLSARSPFRRHALEQLPATTGYPRRAIALALDNLWGALRAPELRTVVRTQAIGGAEPARLAFHVLSGNVPGAGVFGIVAALLAGVPSIVKTARREPLLPALVAQSIAAEDARLGGALAVVHWGRDGDALTGIAVERADVVLAYGTAQTVDAIAERGPRRLLRYGPRLSVALIAGESVETRVARQTAWQVALFDQQGCLSPQLVIVEDVDRARTAEFVAALTAELERLATVLPAGLLSLAEAAAVWRYRERQRWRAQEGADLLFHDDPEGRFSVAYDRCDTLVPSPLNRHVTVVPVPALAVASHALAPFRGLVEAIGFAGPPRRVADAAAVSAACGATRLCPIERMQAPPFAWRQSGHGRLTSLVEPEAGSDSAAAASSAER